jgi:outer membrane protein OmpA-like peptidoglycan-associated protein
MNLFDLINQTLSASVMEQIAELTQEKPAKIQQALNVSAAGLVGSLMKRISSETGMKLVHNQISKITFVSDDFIKNLKDEQGLSQLVAIGDKILNTILPNIKSPIVGLISKVTGIRNSKSSLLCSLSALLVTSALRNKMIENNLDAESLASYLGEQRTHLLEVSPADNNSIIEATGIGHLLNNFSVPQNMTANTPQAEMATTTKKTIPTPFLDGKNYEETTTNAGPIFKWVAGSLVAAAVVVGGFYFWNEQKNSSITEQQPDTTAISQNEARLIEEPVIVSKLDSTKIDTTKKITPTTAFTEIVQTYLADTTKAKGRTFRFDNVDFENNTTTLNPESVLVVAELANLLKKYPLSEVKFIVYANDAQLPTTNRMLSVKRAFAIKSQLIDAGISIIRMDAEGRSNGMDQKEAPSPKPLREVYMKFIKK